MRNFLLIGASAFFIWIIFHHITNTSEEKKYPPLGQLVEVDGKNMHVYTQGEGPNTIVLLSGLGTAAPVLDFEPLINEMSKNNKVVVVEPFGYGWSDVTNSERTVEKIVEEIRSALLELNIEGPYILMPHSASGLYSMYYANEYPNEVKAIIGIDPTLPQALEYFNESAPSMPKYMSLVAPTGIARIVLNIMQKDFLPIAEDGTYSDENIKMTKAISAWKISNKNIVAETNELKNTFEKTKDMAFPQDLPVLIFTTMESGEENEEGKSMQTFYKSQLSNLSFQKLVTLEGHHYLHWTNYKEINKNVNEFIDTFE